MGANAQTSVPTFTAGDVLTAANMNISARTGVPVFADSTARDAGFGGTGEKVLAEGQLCYLESTNVVQYYDGAAWATVGPSTSAVAQVKSTAKTDTFTSTSTSFTDITGLSVSITPTNASNKVLVNVSISVDGPSGDFPEFQLVRDSTAIGIADAAGNRTRATFQSLNDLASGNQMSTESMMFLDSPATTSATTYKLQGRVGSGTFYINRSVNDTDTASTVRGISTITVFEVTP